MGKFMQILHLGLLEDVGTWGIQATGLGLLLATWDYPTRLAHHLLDGRWEVVLLLGLLLRFLEELMAELLGAAEEIHSIWQQPSILKKDVYHMWIHNAYVAQKLELHYPCNHHVQLCANSSHWFEQWVSCDILSPWSVFLYVIFVRQVRLREFLCCAF